MEPKTFLTFEEASTEYYKTHQPISDEGDAEEDLIMHWVEAEGYTIKDII